MQLALIAAVARNGTIGRDGTLPWHLPADMRHFRRLTTGHAIVMGRKTWESIGRPLPKRTNIAVSRTLAPDAAEGIHVCRSLDEALECATGHASAIAYVIGGASLYAEAMPRVDVVELTRVEADVEGDVHFPAFDEAAFRCVAAEAHPADEKHEHAFRFERWLRR